MGLLSVLLFIPVGVVDDATLRSIDGTFDALCKELHDIAQARTSFGHEWDEWLPEISIA